MKKTDDLTRKRTIISIGLILLIVWVLMIIFFSQESGVSTNLHTNKYLEILEHFISLDSDKKIWWFTTIGRKIAHLIIYIILSILTYFFCSTLFQRWKITLSPYKITFLFGIIFAITDEIHQVFIPGRNASLIDVAIDTLGVLLGILLIKKFFKPI